MSYPRRPHSATRATTRDRPYRSTPEPRCRPRVGIRRIPHVPRPLALYRQNVPFAVRCRGVSWSLSHKSSSLEFTVPRSPSVDDILSIYGVFQSQHPRRCPIPDRQARHKLRVGTSETGSLWAPVGVGQGNLVLRQIRAAHTPPLGRPQGIAPTGHSPGRDTGTNVIPKRGARVVICRLQRLGASAMLGS